MDFAEQLRILQAAQGDTALLTLATVDLAHPRLSVAERARINEALVAGAVPHWFDRKFLAALLQTTPEESEKLLGQLRTLTVVEPFPARGDHAVNVHEAARIALREHLRTSDVALWQMLSTRARAHVAQSHEPHARIEALYHLFATDQAAAAAESEALDQEFALGDSPEVLSALAFALRELTVAGWLEGTAEFEALLCPAEIRNSRGEAAQLEAEARRLVDLARTASHPTGIGRAQCLLGDVLRTKGRLDDALAAFREAFAIFQPLAETDPSNAGWQRELAVSQSRAGDIHQAQGRLDDALAAFREAFAIFQHLAETDPSNAGWQRGLAVSHSRAGDIHLAQGRLDDALAAFREDLAISQHLAETDPSNAGWQRELAVSQSKIGDIHQEQDRLDDALAAFHEYLAISQRLAETDPSNAGWQRELAVSQSKMGDIHQAQGRLDDALAAFREALALFQPLAATDPSNAGWQRGLAVSQSKIGDIHLAQGRLDDALAAFREDLAISQHLSATDPSNAGWQRDLAIAHLRLGEGFRIVGIEEKAKSSFRSAVKTMELAVAAAPGNVGWEDDLAELKKLG